MLMHGTTVIGLKKNNRVAMGADGQVTLGDTIIKANAKKIRLLYNNSVVAGFAGAVADAMTLFERFEEKLDEVKGNLYRAAINLAKDWRTDKYLRNLEAMLAVYDKQTGLLISGTGDIIEPDDGIVAIGSGGNFAMAAAKALIQNTDLNASEIVTKSLEIASEICVFTNRNLYIKELE
ncbi:MAG: ATP-dependent protease subunit HslV [Candidatus Delongbacteria bacterium]|nr:ATP-dependent protease subunit HslV [Candidatus Delongbacteria bacterium]